MNDPSTPLIDVEGNEGAKFLSPAPAYRRMALVGVAGVVLLALVGWAAVAAGNPSTRPLGLAYELSTTAEGIVHDVPIHEGQHVVKGDLLVLLDDSAEQIALQAARDELSRVAQGAQQAGIAVAMPPGSGIGGQIIQTGPMPRATAAPANGKLAALPPVTGAEAHQSAKAPASIQGAAQQDVDDITAKIEAKKAEVLDLSQKRDDALAQGDEAQRNADASKAIAEQRKKQSDKMQMLLGEGAVSRVEAQRAESLSNSAQGGADAAQKLADEQKAAAADFAAQAQAAQAAIPKLEADLKTAKDLAAKAPALEAPATAPAIKPYVPITTPAASKPAFVRSTPAPAVPAKVEIDKSAKRAVDDKLGEAKRKVDEAEARVEARRILAPRAGTIVKVVVRPGDSLHRGQTLVFIKFDETP